MNPVPFPAVPRLALLDWDGTFCDSRKSIYDINVEMAEFYGKQMPSYESWLQASHPGVEACMRSLGIEAERQDLNDMFHTLLLAQREAGFRNPLYPDAEELLRLFQEQGLPAVVISRHPHHHLLQDIAAHGLSSFFSRVIGEPEEAELEKSAVMREVCEDCGLPGDQAFYLGDTSHDMRLAREAGVAAIAVCHGYDPESEIAREQPAYIFSSLKEIIQFFS